MNIKTSLLTLALVLPVGTMLAQTDDVITDTAKQAPRYEHPVKTYRYRVYFTDKKNNPYSVSHPEQFLSAKALERRRKFRIKVDKADLPVTPMYVEYLHRNFDRVLHTSKWNNTAVIETTDSARAQALPSTTFISRVCRVWESPDSVLVNDPVDRRTLVTDKRDTLTATYGHGLTQAHQINADGLHALGFCGEGMTIAIIDGGFYNADIIAATRGCRILGTKDFTGASNSVYETTQDHGTMVLSCIGTQMEGCLVGTAPEAQFYLLQSEDGATEQMVEEDNWCAALEYADSLGVDVVTTSLGYTTFDHPEMTPKYYELDGRTRQNSREASMAASRGLMVLNSAGNSGMDSWKKIGTPADADNILAVGAVTKDGENTWFSSIGLSADGRIKPDVMAMGQRSAVVDASGDIGFANGTSFSCPILAGGVACLMQACPDKTPMEIIDAVRRSGNNAAHPDNIFGYGIPDLVKAREILTKKK